MVANHDAANPYLQLAQHCQLQWQPPPKAVPRQIQHPQGPQQLNATDATAQPVSCKPQLLQLREAYGHAWLAAACCCLLQRMYCCRRQRW